MSDVDFTPTDPTPGTEGVTDFLPDDVVQSVLRQSGFGSDEVADPSSLGQEEQEGATSESQDTPPPEAPGGSSEEVEADEDPADSVRLPDGRLLPLALVTEWADQQSRPSLPPAPPPAELPLTGGPGPVQGPAFQLPPITAEDLEMAGPVARALLMVANAQAQQQKELREQYSSLASQVSARQQRENAELANSAATSFQRTYNLPDDLMTEVKNGVERSDIEAYLSRKPDAYEAVEYALKRSYNDNPKARQYEFERMSEARQTATTRKRKLAGISGSGGSGPRGAPAIDPSNPDALKQAAIEEVRAAMYGDQQ
jgi:hypothetical protein